MKNLSIFSDMLNKSLRNLGLMMALACIALPSHSAFINIQDFNNLSAFTLNGSTGAIDTGGQGILGQNVGDGGVLRLTNNFWQAGSAFYSIPFSLGANASFSSYFEFQFSKSSQWVAQTEWFL